MKGVSQRRSKIIHEAQSSGGFWRETAKKPINITYNYRKMKISMVSARDDMLLHSQACGKAKYRRMSK